MPAEAESSRTYQNAHLMKEIADEPSRGNIFVGEHLTRIGEKRSTMHPCRRIQQTTNGIWCSAEGRSQTTSPTQIIHSAPNPVLCRERKWYDNPNPRRSE